MKNPNDLSNNEMVKKFKEVYKLAFDEYNKTVEDSARKPQYLWESIMEIVLDLSEDEWAKLNE